MQLLRRAVVDIGLHVIQQVSGQRKGLFVEDCEGHIQVVILQKVLDRLHGHGQRLFLREAVGAGGDQRKGDALAAQLFGQQQRFAVTGCEGLELAGFAAPPGRAHGVDDVFRGQGKCGGHRGLARMDRPDLAALRQQLLRPRRFIDGAVCACADDRLRIRSVDDGVRRHLGDIVSNDGKRHCRSFLYSPYSPYSQPTWVASISSNSTSRPSTRSYSRTVPQPLPPFHRRLCFLLPSGAS